ncbi:efflux RND transporter permease subunit [Teredinibacter purpureus]|uniref:efflux RND transporter permease subunit n=1 Tax=Teredinibacter purpureus TaxID=2731756 RepID=UPI0005F7C58C|nr:MMPL family transporter [Teredinibacter purpureus]
MFGRLFDHYIATITRFPKVTLLLLAVVLIGASVALPNFKLDASSDSLTLENDTDLEFYRDVIKAYGSGDFLVVTFRPQAPLFTDPSLAVLAKLRGELASIDGVVSVNSILDVPLLYSPKLSLSEMVSEPRNLQTSGVDYALAREEFLVSPAYRDLILGPDAQTTALQLNLAVDERYINLVKRRDDLLRIKKTEGSFSIEQQLNYTDVSRELLVHRTAAAERDHQRVELVRSVVNRYRDRAQIYVGGLTMITADMISFIKSDLIVFGSAVLLFMVFVLAIIFRSWYFVVIPMACCSAAVLIMLGYVSWIDWRLTVISSNFVALLLIISLAIIIHLIVRYREFSEQNPQWDQRELVTATVKFMILPCLYTVMTSVVAFASLVVSNIRPVIDFGWLMTMGLVLAFFLAFTLLPAAMMLLPRKKPNNTEKDVTVDDGAPVTLVFSRFVETRGTWVLACSVLLALASGWGVTQLQVENRFIDYFHESTEIHQGLSVIDNDLGGTTSLDIIINYREDSFSLEMQGFVGEDDPFGEGDPFDESDPFESLAPLGDEDPFSEVDPFSEHGEDATSYWMTLGGLRTIEKIHDYLESLPEVGKVQSLAILYKIGMDISGSLNDVELAVMQKKLPRSIKDALVSPYLDANNNQARITLRIHDGYPNLSRAELVERIERHLLDNEWVEAEDLRFSGLLVLYNNMLQSLFSSQIATLGTVLLGILVMFVVLFRSLSVAAIAIVPTVLSAVGILGFMGVFGLPLDMMTITVAAITVGIGVDNTIHYVHRFRRELEFDKDYIASMHRAHQSIGRAMFYTSVIIIFGFAIMVLSAFIPTIYFGLLTGLAMFLALLGALLLLPKLILLTKPFSV